jgi:hypothetical protein
MGKEYNKKSAANPDNYSEAIKVVSPEDLRKEHSEDKNLEDII